MEDLGGIGRATEKFLAVIQSAIGTVYRPRALRLEGRAAADAEAYKIVALAKAEKEARLVRSDADAELAERAVARLRHQEMTKQLNIESTIDRAISELDNHKINDNIDIDWFRYFFDNCGSISDSQVQALWAKVLARQATSNQAMSRKLIDCLRWLDSELANQFIQLATPLYLFGGFFEGEISFGDDGVVDSYARFSYGNRLEEIGLLREVSASMFSFRFDSFRIICQELSALSIEQRGFFEFTNTGSQLAQIICPQIVSLIRWKEEDVHAFSGPRTLDQLDEAESFALSQEDLVKAVVGGIVMFFMRTTAVVKIEKEYVNDGMVHFDNIMTISHQNSKDMKIRRSRKRVVIDSLYRTESKLILA
jgi:hypothetical protein